MSQAHARLFAERIGMDGSFRKQLLAGWQGAQAPTLTDITEIANRAGFTFSVEDLRLVLKHDIKMRDNIASLQPEFRFDDRPAEYEDGPEIY